MKTISLLCSLLVTSSAFSHDTLAVKSHPSTLHVQGGYVVYTTPLYRGHYLSLGYKYQCNKFLWYNAQFFLMQGKYTTHSNYIAFDFPTLQIRSISTGLSGEYGFYRKHSIEAGAGVNFSVIQKSSSYMQELFYYQTLNVGYYGSFSYLYRITNYFKTGFVYTKTVIHRDRFNSPYQLDMYGCIIQLKF
jgi:hypothetical protein